LIEQGCQFLVTDREIRIGKVKMVGRESRCTRAFEWHSGALGSRRHRSTCCKTFRKTRLWCNCPLKRKLIIIITLRVFIYDETVVQRYLVIPI